MKILILCAHPPWPPDSGTPLRSWGWLRTASKVARIGLVSLTTGRKEEQDSSALREYCDFVRQVHVPRVISRRLCDLILAMGRGTPYVVQAAHCAQMVEAVSSAIDQWQPDIVQAEWLGAAPYLEEARLRDIPTIYAAHNIEHQVVSQRARRWGQRMGPFSAATLRAAETSYACKADLVVTVTEEDKKWFQQLNKQVICIANAVHVDEYRFLLPSARAIGPVVFVGHLRYPPNIEAARELIHTVFPRIHKQLPDVGCVIAGRQPSSSLRQLARGKLSVRGDIKDMTTVWNQASALISPLRSGGGSRIKLLQAAACGVPIIATPFSAHGLALVPDRDFIAASDSVGLADFSVAGLRDPGRWDALARQARKTVEQHHNWNNFTGKLQQLYEGLAHHHR